MAEVPITKQKEKNLAQTDRLIMLMGLGIFSVVALDILITWVWKDLRENRPRTEEQLVIEPDRSRDLIDFSLVDQSGHRITRKDFEGKIVVVNFIFASCSTVCPLINSQIAEMQKKTAQRSDVLFLSLSVDPVDDTVPILAQYCRKFGGDPAHPGRWSFVTGEESTMEHLISSSFLAQDTTGTFGYMPGNFANTQYLALVNRQGHVTKYFNGLNPEMATAVLKELEKLR